MTICDGLYFGGVLALSTGAGISDGIASALAILGIGLIVGAFLSSGRYRTDW